ncbi:FxsA protein [Klebsiella quasipneumoniae]|nr:FxsA protein [Klebsiella quasipneumoniae]
MRWIPFIAFFLYVYIEISIFIQVAHVLGVFMTLILVIFSSVVGMSLVRNQGFKNFLLMQQKMAAGESPAAEMIKSVSLIIAGLLLLIPGFFTDFLGLLLLLPPVQKHLTMKLMPHLRFSRMPGGGFSAGTGGGETFEGNSSARTNSATVWTIRTIAAINFYRPGQQTRPGRFLICAYTLPVVASLRLGKNNHSAASITSAYRLFQPTIASSSRQRMLPTAASSR